MQRQAGIAMLYVPLSLRLGGLKSRSSPISILGFTVGAGAE